jgi:hypothetical protein
MDRAREAGGALRAVRGALRHLGHRDQRLGFSRPSMDVTIWQTIFGRMSDCLERYCGGASNTLFATVIAENAFGQPA